MRVRASFAGRVQGVGFRATTRDAAGGFKVAGWVRNEPDGTVTVEVQGEAGEIDGFLSVVRQRLGRYITTTQRIDILDVNGAAGFTIQR